MAELSVNPIEKLKQELAYEKTLSCVQCGYCLPACPTYESFGTETHSPRGRINLVRMTAEGHLTNWDHLAQSLDYCLGCRACEPACPTGVNYGVILESAREAIVARRQYSAPVRAMRRIMLRSVFPSKRILHSAGVLLWVYQASRLDKVVNGLRINRILPKSMAEFSTVIPKQSSPLARWQRPKRFTPPANRQPTMRVAFFTGCIMDAMFERVNRLSMKLLAAAGCEVITIPNETCCGALHAHAGEREDAKELARRNIAAYEKLNAQTPVDYIVNNAGGCGAMLVEYDHLLADDPQWAARAQQYAAKSKDISVLLAKLDLPIVPQKQREPVTITYQRSCHMTNVQKVTREPLQLLARIPNVKLVEMKDKDRCCGSAGIYNLVHYDESMEVLDIKMRHTKETGAATVVTTNPGCLLQMQMGIEREGERHRMCAVHLVELLAEACGIED